MAFLIHFSFRIRSAIRRAAAINSTTSGFSRAVRGAIMIYLP
jgi:hypothetical protein